MVNSGCFGTFASVGKSARRVLRGGSWNNNNDNNRLANRNNNNPNNRNNNYGFRVGRAWRDFPGF